MSSGGFEIHFRGVKILNENKICKGTNMELNYKISDETIYFKCTGETLYREVLISRISGNFDIKSSSNI